MGTEAEAAACKNYMSSKTDIQMNHGTSSGGAFAGWKTKGGYFKTVRNTANAQACFEACAENDKCKSFTFNESKMKCSMSDMNIPTSSGEKGVKLCRSANSIAGFVNKAGSSSSGITASEVATHNDRSSAWIIYNGKVYDVTDFISEHPGGSSSILRYAGRDATRVFNANHGSTERRDLERYYIGDLSGSLPVVDNNPGLQDDDAYDTDDDDDAYDTDDDDTDDERDDDTDDERDDTDDDTDDEDDD